jgi:hypothetical protein
MSNRAFVANATFTFERRRYGKTTYTWAFLVDGSKRISLGDPWNCLNPKRLELEEAAIAALEALGN